MCVPGMSCAPMKLHSSCLVCPRSVSADSRGLSCTAHVPRPDKEIEVPYRDIVWVKQTHLLVQSLPLFRCQKPGCKRAVWDNELQTSSHSKWLQHLRPAVVRGNHV
jgi:hypothetical protein